MAAVIFNYGQFIARYPEFAAVDPTLVAAYFAEATLYCDNTASSPIKDDSPGGVRSLLLNMVVAHICQLNAPVNGQAPSPLVGRISSATEGSVTVQAQFDVPAGTAQWWAQTKYGAAFWAATKAYRMMHYFPSSGRTMDPWAGR